MARACACLYVCISKCMNSFTPKYTLVTLWPFVMQWMVRTENNANACLMKTCKQICKQANRKTSIGCDFEDQKRYKPNQTKTKQIQSTEECEHFSLTPVDQWNFCRHAWGIDTVTTDWCQNGKLRLTCDLKKKTTINYGLATAHNKSHEF